jgi:hypothetical protein
MPPSSPSQSTGQTVGHRLSAAALSLSLGLGLVLTLALSLAEGHTSSLAEQQVGAQPPGAAEQATQTLLALSARYQAASDPATRAQLLGALTAAAAARQQLLAALIEEDPGAVLRVALPAGLVAGLPAAVQAFVEQEADLEGTLEVRHEDRADGSRYLYSLDTALGRLALHFASDPPALQTGDHVRVTGLRLNEVMALSSGNSVTPVITVFPNTFGAQKTILILVVFQDKTTPPYSVTTALSVMAQTSNFFLENSYGQTWLTGVVNPSQPVDVYGWFTIAMSSTVCDYNTLETLAKSAATAAGAVLSSYTHLVFGFPQNACTWWGLGTVGGNPSYADINGSIALKVVSHEVGHNLGLYHSHSQSCDTSGCTVSEYGDTLDTMGIPNAGHYNAFQKERLGWLGYGNSPPIATAQASGNYWLDPYEPLGIGPKALAALKATDPTTGRKTWYYLEYRQKLGFDAGVASGVIVHTGSEASANSSYLFDLFPSTSTFNGLLGVGQSYYDPNAGVTLTTLSADSTGALVDVTLGATACVPGTPILTVSPSATAWIGPGGTVTYTVAVTNTDSGGCAASTFTLGAAAPSGWAAGFTSPTLTVSPGASGSTTLQTTASTSGTGGTYAVTLTATDSASSSTASTSVLEMLVTSLSVGVSTDKASYTRNQSVTMTVSASSGGTAVPNASVTVTIKKPDNSAVTLMATTGSDGKAVVQYRIKSRDPVGTYSAQAVAALGGVSGSATTSFTATK